MVLQRGLSGDSSILAIVTHYRYEQWLGQCLESLTAQTRQLNGIVVVDDHSPAPPVEIIRNFPTVTLLTADENVGPYRLLQSVMEMTDYDGYMMNDSDDWSTADRLELSLREAAASGAEMVGTQIENICDFDQTIVAPVFPRDTRAAVLANPGSHPLALASSVVSRRLVESAGGLATGLRFGGDTEFVRRAVFLGKVVCLPQRCYFRRIHRSSATRHPDTGFGSALRQVVKERNDTRSHRNVRLVKRGRRPNLRPLTVAPGVLLRRVCGPELRMRTLTTAKAKAVA